MDQKITAIWNEFHKELRGFILKRTQNVLITDDILQDVFVKILTNMAKIDHAENIRPYLYGIVKNTINDYFRKAHHSLGEESIPEILSSEDEKSLNEKVAECCIRPFIMQLNPQDQEVLLKVEFENLSQKELAEQLGMSYSGLKSRLQRAKEKLKNQIVDCCAYKSDAFGNLLESNQKNCACPDL
jgi:RNA polymerase sigma-70 factor (ECF subfamily)